MLNERQMAEQLGVSTTPLKEALRRLEGEGLVVTEPRRGIRVTFDAAQAEEMALARAALEGMIARMTAERIDDAESPARAIRRRDERRHAGPASRRLIALNEAFHDAIHADLRLPLPAAHPRGTAGLCACGAQFILSDVDERGRALAEHRAIFEALARRDPDAAERAMRDHVVRSAAPCERLSQPAGLRRAAQGSTSAPNDNADHRHLTEQHP